MDYINTVDAIQRAKELERDAERESACGNILVAAALRDEATKLRLDVERMSKG
jgi:hypothetical protein